MKKQKRKNKSFYLVAVAFSFFIFFFCCDFVSAQTILGERITKFAGEIKINPDSTIEIKENISYDFGENQKHGIFRFIPVKYKARGGNFNLRVSDVKIADEKGAAYNFKTTHEGNNIKFQIGDADKLISGEKTYMISYTVRRAVNYFETHDELYWNFTGDEWKIPIENASVQIILPENAIQNQQFKCFEGIFGSTNECDAAVSKNILQYQATGQLMPGEGMTIVAGWPKGITAEPTVLQKIWDIVRDNWTLFMPILVFIFMFRLWWKKGRDPKGRGTIIAEYESPDQLSPAEMGTMLDGSADNKDISATIIDLAVRGYLKIRRTEEKGIILSSKEYTFTRIKNEDPEREFEKDILMGLFGNAKEKKLSDLKNKFYKTLSDVKDKLYENVTQAGYYAKNPNTQVGLWIAGAIVGGAFLAFGFGMLQGGWGVASGILSGIITLIFGWLMPAVTKKGAELKEKILGFRSFLSITETDRLKFHNAPEKNPDMFEKFLPHAMVLGVEKEWAKQFEGIYNQQPDWYDDSSGRAFNAVVLSNMVNDFSGTAVSTMSSQPSSASGGGSGFSGGGGGGGFGGGGGGSW